MIRITVATLSNDLRFVCPLLLSLKKESLSDNNNCCDGKPDILKK